MNAIDSGDVIHEGRYCRVVYHEGRQQPAAFAYARRYEGENV